MQDFVAEFGLGDEVVFCADPDDFGRHFFAGAGEDPGLNRWWFVALYPERESGGVVGGFGVFDVAGEFELDVFDGFVPVE
ncbi:MAG: hypothetical protein GWM98_12540 [Nitrospinaceae bacterium]|nr:hypothetical protein [Nitrospinaceae bacterium]NIT82427.1 hypothetical protein [Nitrospinaceae bacterium]NIY15656.1 hypothetical protein [Nitrospinaceae bacterium]